MHVTCPYCRDSIDARPAAVRCARCATPYHRECWLENHGTCAIAGCGATEHRAFTKRAATRIVLAAGGHAVAHGLKEAQQRLGAKSVVVLLLLSAMAVAVGSGVAVRPFTTFAHSVEVALVGVFLVLAAWIATLLYRGDRLEHDLDLKVADEHVGTYYRRLWRGLTGERDSGGSGCGDCGSGCSGVDGEGIVVVLVILVAVAVLVAVGPLVAWVAVELIYPIIAIAVYGVMYSALSFAVHAHERYAGRLLASIGRGVLFSGIYTGLIAAVFEVMRALLA